MESGGSKTGLSVLCTYQSENRQLERLFLSGMYHSQLDSNPVFSYMPCNNQQGNRYYMYFKFTTTYMDVQSIRFFCHIDIPIFDNKQISSCKISTDLRQLVAEV